MEPFDLTIRGVTYIITPKVAIKAFSFTPVMGFTTVINGTAKAMKIQVDMESVNDQVAMGGVEKEIFDEVRKKILDELESIV